MDTKQYHRYALACPTSMGVRITPPERMAVPRHRRRSTWPWASERIRCSLGCFPPLMIVYHKRGGEA